MTEQTQTPGVEVKPLTNWKNAPKLTDLKQDLQDAKPIHDAQVARISEWLDNLNITGKAKVDAPKGNSRIVPKLIRKQAEWRYAALTEPFMSTDDLFNARPMTLNDRKSAQQNALVLNNQFNTQIDKVSFIDEYVRTGVDEGTIIARVGWEFVEEDYEIEQPIVEFRVSPDFAPMHEQLAQMKAQSPSQYNAEVPDELKQAHELSIEKQQPIQPFIIGRETVTKQRTLINRPTVEVCDFRNVVIDPTAKGDMEKARFVIYTFESSMAELKEDGKYKNLDKISITNNNPLSQPDYAANEATKTFNFSDEPRKRVVVYEYWGFWDIDGTGLVKPFVAAWVGDTLIRLEENPYPDKKLPFVVEKYLPVRKTNYGEPDGALLEDNQKVIGAVTRGMIDILGKSANGQTGMRKDMLDATNRRKFDRGQDYEFNIGVDPRMGVHMHTFPEIPSSAQFMVQTQNQDAESLTGVKSFSDGVSGQSLGQVAAGVRGALDAASKRELGILRRMSDGLVKIGRKIISMNAEFLSEEEVVRLTDEEFVTVLRDDLAGNFDLRLSISTAEQDDNQAKELGFMLQTMGPNMDPEMSRMILGDIARLRKMPDLAKKIESYQPQPDPLVQQQRELEIELLRAKIAKENAQAQQALAAAQLGGAKVNTEAAKAGNLQADTDKKDLDFVEQESGVTQERALQQTGEQARSQGQLKVLDHQFKEKEQKFDLLKEYVKANAAEVAI